MKSSVMTRWLSAVRWPVHKHLLVIAAVLIVVAVTVGAAVLWYPRLPYLVASELGLRADSHAADDGHDHAAAEHDGHDREAESHDGHDHATAGGEEHAEMAEASAEFGHRHSEAETIKLSAQAQANIGVQLTRVELQPFDRSVTLPGMVVERPGWSIVEVTAPMTGVVTRIYCVQGEAIEPGQSLFDLRLTHEDLLQVQTDFLRTVEELDVIGREIARLEKIAADGVIAGKTLLERKYDQQRQEAMLRTLRQALLLHGLNEEQVDTITRTRSLVQELTIFAPVAKRDSSGPALPKVLQIRQLNVSQGRSVNAGDALCALANHEELYIEGHAFEQDMPSIIQVAAEKRDVAISLDAKGAGPGNLPGLKILYMDDIVDAQSRTFHFYITLPNQLLREDKSPQGRRFVYWQFRPGQRAQISLPVERWEDRIVLPVEAVASDGAEFYVFEANGDHFDRRSVNVEFRDQRSAVIANDGSLRIGSQVARSAAHQMQLAMKNKAGGGVDPHAGHNH
ncbi:MAG: efflux RND transporter periplasmic adaptor subunit [Pirellulaceae bacterium]